MGTKVIRRGKPPPKIKPTRRFSTLNSLKARVVIEEPKPECETADGHTDGKMDRSELEGGLSCGGGSGGESRIGDGGDGISNDVLESMDAVSRERVLQERQRNEERERYRQEYRSFSR
jgi:hypothetical protein